MSWPIWTSDIATAFLEGRPQSRKLWVQLPTECLELLGASADTRMLLLKPCYAPTAWYLAAVDKLKAMGLKQHPKILAVSSCMKASSTQSLILQLTHHTC